MLIVTIAPPPPPPSPQRDARPLFEVLVAKYAQALQPRGGGDLSPLVASIGQKYFNIQPPQDGMAALMSSLFGGGGGGAAGFGGAQAAGLRPRLAGAAAPTRRA